MSFQRFPRGFPNFGSRPQLGGHDPKSGRRRFVPIFAIRRNPKMLTGIPQLWVTTPELGGSRPHKRPTPLRVLCSRFTELYRVLRNMDIHCRLWDLFCLRFQRFLPGFQVDLRRSGSDGGRRRATPTTWRRRGRRRQQWRVGVASFARWGVLFQNFYFLF